jgi:hypothetical protein
VLPITYLLGDTITVVKKKGIYMMTKGEKNACRILVG